MPFPLPLDPEFRIEVIGSWLDDVEDRLDLGDLEGAKYSWKIANTIYLSLPPGYGCDEVEHRFQKLRVKLQ